MEHPYHTLCHSTLFDFFGTNKVKRSCNYSNAILTFSSLLKRQRHFKNKSKWLQQLAASFPILLANEHIQAITKRNVYTRFIYVYTKKCDH